MRKLLLVPAMMAAGLLAGFPAESAAQKKKPDIYEKAIKKIEASFDPAEAKPGQTVTYRLAVTLNEDFMTYPTRQPEKQAESLVNKINFPEPGSVVFVGLVIDPPDFKKKSEPELGIKELRYYAGKAVYERKAVVSPTAKAGEVTVKLPSFKLTVCDKDNCYPSKTLMPEAVLKVLSGPAVPVDPAYAEDVKKAGGM